MFDIFTALKETDSLGKNMKDLLLPDWNPNHANGSLNGGPWGRREEHKDNAPGPEICWDPNGSVEPLGLIDMDEEEKEVGPHYSLRPVALLLTATYLVLHGVRQLASETSAAKRWKGQPFNHRDSW